MKKLNRALLIAVLSCIAFLSNAQITLLKKDVDDQMLRNDSEESIGPNLKHFFSRGFGYGLAVPLEQDDSMRLRKGFGSFDLYIHTRYKNKLSNWLSWGTDLNARMTAFDLRQTNGENILNGGVEHRKQRLTNYALGLGLYLRINYTRRGNAIGQYLDVGVDGSWVYASRLRTHDRPDPATNAGSGNLTTIASNLNYATRWQGFYTARLGFGRIALYGKYRFTDIFQSAPGIYRGEKMPELTRLILGIEFSIYNQ